jgi:hypothetical protein
LTETGKTYNSEADRQDPKPLQDAEVAYVLAAAAKRMTLDGLIAAWRDWLHYGMNSPGAVDMIHTIHSVMDSMDDFLNHRSRK